MRFLLQPGHIIACKINAHRAEWNGTICEDAANWNCSAKQDFREDYCVKGDDRCFHVRTFDGSDPSMVIEENGASWLLRDAPDALDDQLLVFWGGRASTPLGIPDRDQRNILYGAYRVRTVEEEDLGHRTQWRVRPYEDGWVCFAGMNVPRPRYEELGGPYLKQIEPDELRAVFEDQRMLRTLDTRQQSRFRTFSKHLEEWLTSAQAKTSALHERLGTGPKTAPPHRQAPVQAPVSINRPFSKLGALVKSRVEEAPAPDPAAGTIPAKTAQPRASTKQSLDVLTAEVSRWIRETHGEDLLLDLRVALATRDLVVLRGEPGVGKSHLALNLLADPERARTLVVPVSATWRGREDLLGYVNPMDGRFVKTPFTLFLEQAAAAWTEGARQARIVIFEEFNLSQPEHWFADILAISQYEREIDRCIQLAGAGAGEDERVFLSPAVRFVGTVNNDHTTRSLSPRVLDRAAVVHLELGPKEALERVGLSLDPHLVKAIAGLDFRLRPRGASFSIRTARSLQVCLTNGLVPSRDEALDLVLAQQVLSKVQLAAHDSTDLRLLEELEEWSEEQKAGLRRCVSIVARWRESLDAGLDVLQA